MESGRVKVDQQKKQYDFEIKGAKVFATANDISRLSKPLQSRFRKLFLPRYTEEQFLDVSEKVLSNTSPSMPKGIRKGFVARSFNIPAELDERLKIKAAKDKVRFSEITISALEQYLK